MTDKPILPPIQDNEWPQEIADLMDGFAGALGPERSEVVILRVAFRFGSGYEWNHHVDRATRLGFSAERIATVGFYAVLGYILMTYRTPLDAGIADVFSGNGK